MNQIGVIGAGTMGNGIAQVFASTGHQVTLVEVKEDLLQRGLSMVRKSLERLESKGKLAPQAVDGVLARLKGSTKLVDVAHCDLVIEAVTEQLDVKTRVFQSSTASSSPRASWRRTLRRSRSRRSARRRSARTA
jgi:3-hydroxyacyl-CoA dehydrogenase